MEYETVTRIGIHDLMPYRIILFIITTLLIMNNLNAKSFWQGVEYRYRYPGSLVYYTILYVDTRLVIR